MQHRATPRHRGIQHFFQTTTIVLIAALAFSATAYTLACAIGMAPWMTVPMTFGDVQVANAGMYIQIVFSVFLISLAFTIPSAMRIMVLENSHRDFRISMEDVATAYRTSHAADRAGVFTMAREFDSVRARIKHLREHPSLGGLEAGILEAAAQMTHESRDLADVYSDEKVNRARVFLEQRQHESAEMLGNVKMAEAICDELREWTDKVEDEEAEVATKIQQLEKQLATLVPNIKIPAKFDDTVVRIATSQRKPNDALPKRM